ncbi:hypothetical protein VIMY103929_06370 [Vibrio mytili]
MLTYGESRTTSVHAYVNQPALNLIKPHKISALAFILKLAQIFLIHCSTIIVQQ